MEFQRYTAPDAAALAADIVDARAKLAAAVDKSNAAAMVDHAGDLSGMLTTARREAEALQVLQAQVGRAESLPGEEATSWFWNAYATALQYLGRRDEAHEVFEQALALSRAGGWLRLQSFVLQHRGRCLVELDRWDKAEAAFQEALHLRQHLNDPFQASTQRALDALAVLRGSVERRAP